MWQKFIHKYLRLPYILNAREFHSPSRPHITIILLHGIGSSLTMWEPLVNKLPKKARVIGIDLLGFGASPQPSWNVYGVSAQADSLAATLLSLRISGPTVVVGHSLGALVAIEFARRHPLTTRGLVLISPPLYKLSRDRGRFSYRPEEILQRMYHIMQDNPKDTEKVLRIASKYNLINRGFSAEHVNVHAYLATLDATIINQRSYHDILEIRLPIHILTGKFDIFVQDKVIDTITEMQSNITHTSVIAGHEIVGAMRTAVYRAIQRMADIEGRGA